MSSYIDKSIRFGTARSFYNENFTVYSLVILGLFVAIIVLGLDIWRKLIGVVGIILYCFWWSKLISNVVVKNNGVFLRRILSTQKLNKEDIVKIYWDENVSMNSFVYLKYKNNKGVIGRLPLVGSSKDYEHLIEAFSDYYRIDKRIPEKMRKRKLKK